MRGGFGEWRHLAGVYALVQGALWTTGGTQLVFALLAAAWVLLSTFLAARTPRQLGITLSGLTQSLWVVPATMCVAGLLILGGWMTGSLHDLHGRHAPLWHGLLYLVWAFVQQFMLQSFLFVRLEAVLGDGRKAVLATALLFSVAHIPNAVLVAATFVLAMVVTEVFRRHRNLYPLAIAHGLLGLALAVSLPDALTHHMRVGIAYWN